MTKIFAKKVSIVSDPRKPLAKAARKPWISDSLLGEKVQGLGLRG